MPTQEMWHAYLHASWSMLMQVGTGQGNPKDQQRALQLQCSPAYTLRACPLQRAVMQLSTHNPTPLAYAACQQHCVGTTIYGLLANTNCTAWQARCCWGWSIHTCQAKSNILRPSVTLSAFEKPADCIRCC